MKLEFKNWIISEVGSKHAPLELVTARYYTGGRYPLRAVAGWERGLDPKLASWLKRLTYGIGGGMQAVFRNTMTQAGHPSPFYQTYTGASTVREEEQYLAVAVVIDKKQGVTEDQRKLEARQKAETTPEVQNAIQKGIIDPRFVHVTAAFDNGQQETYLVKYDKEFKKQTAFAGEEE